MQKSASLGNLPRADTSCRQDRQSSDSQLHSKREVKVSDVETVIGALLAAEPANKKERESAMNARTVFDKQD